MNHSIAGVLKLKTNLLEILAVAIIIALGVNVLAGNILNYLSYYPHISMMLGGFLIVLGILHLIRRSAPANNKEFHFNGFLVFEPKEKNFVAVEDYHFSEKISQYIKALFSENKALLRGWNDSDVGFFGAKIGKGGTKKDNSTSNKIIKHAIEYYFLNSLSLHLGSHFINNDKIDDGEIVTMERNDIPNILFENYFLELFSKPMEEREPFIKSGRVKSHGKIVYAMGAGGAIFDHFDLTLPKGSKVTRKENGAIQITTKRFKIEAKVNFDGYASNLPNRFDELYLGKEFMETSTFQAGISLKVDFNISSIFSDSGWEYYWWLDSFIEKLDSSLSKDRFFEKIHWQSNLTLIKIIERMRESKRNDSIMQEKNG